MSVMFIYSEGDGRFVRGASGCVRSGQYDGGFRS